MTEKKAMTCDALRTRLLELPDPAAVSDDLRPHLTTCPACQAFHAEAARLDTILANLPAPSSAARKQALLAYLENPIITKKPSTPTIAAHRPWPALARYATWQSAAALAAAVLIAVGGIWLFNRPNGPGPETAAAAPRHELTSQSVKHAVRLANASGPEGRLAVWTDWSAEFRTQAREVYKVADGPDMTALARQFDRTLSDGLLPQVAQLDTKDPVQRSALLDAADKQMLQTYTDATAWANEAPPASKPALQKIAKSAADARSKIADKKRGV